MKTPSQTFDINRLGHCLRRDIEPNWRGWLLKFLILTAALTIILYIVGKPSDYMLVTKNSSFYEDTQTIETGVNFIFFSYLVCAMGASAMMSNMTTKGLRLDALMSPASTLEKYVSRWLLYVVGVSVAFLISFTIAAGLRVLITEAVYGSIPGLKFIGPIEAMICDETWSFTFLGLLAAQATYALGSVVWPKNSFLKTSGVVIIALLIIFYSIMHIFWMTRPDGCHWQTEGAIHLVWYSYKTACVCWALFCYITAYYRLKESEIIERF